MKIGFFGLLFLVFLVLRLTKVILWNWWWVTAPLWGIPALLIGGSIIGWIIAWFAYRSFKKRIKKHNKF